VRADPSILTLSVIGTGPEGWSQVVIKTGTKHLKLGLKPNKPKGQFQIAMRIEPRLRGLVHNNLFKTRFQIETEGQF